MRIAGVFHRPHSTRGACRSGSGGRSARPSARMREPRAVGRGRAERSGASRGNGRAVGALHFAAGDGGQFPSQPGGRRLTPTSRTAIDARTFGHPLSEPDSQVSWMTQPTRTRPHLRVEQLEDRLDPAGCRHPRRGIQLDPVQPDGRTGPVASGTAADARLPARAASAWHDDAGRHRRHASPQGQYDTRDAGAEGVAVGAARVHRPTAPRTSSSSTRRGTGRGPATRR